MVAFDIDLILHFIAQSALLKSCSTNQLTRPHFPCIGLILKAIKLTSTLCSYFCWNLTMALLESVKMDESS